MKPNLVFSFAILYFLFCLCNGEIRNNFFDDWSVFNESQKIGKRGGVFLQITQKGLDRISELVVKALKISSLQKGTNGSESDREPIPGPKFALRFIKNSGIGAKIFLPKEIFTMPDATTKEDLTAQLLVEIKKDENGFPIFTAPYCESKAGDFRRGIESFVSRQLPEEDFCYLILNSTRCWNLGSRVEFSCWPLNYEVIDENITGMTFHLVAGWAIILD